MGYIKHFIIIIIIIKYSGIIPLLVVSSLTLVIFES